MSWNYRIMDFGDHRALHEVYYDAAGQPKSYTEAPATFVEDADETDGVAGGLKMALDAMSAPVLTPSDFSNEEKAA